MICTHLGGTDIDIAVMLGIGIKAKLPDVTVLSVPDVAMLGIGIKAKPALE